MGGQFIFFPSFNYKMLHCKITDTDMSFISESTAGGTNCVEVYNNCPFKYQYLYNETRVTEIKALRNSGCRMQLSYGKFLDIFVSHQPKPAVSVSVIQ
jgi:hypothetical protein